MMNEVPALPRHLPTRRNGRRARRPRFSWAAFEAHEREQAHREDGRNRPGSATGLPVIQEFVVHRGWRIEGRGENAWIIPTPPTLHRIVRRTANSVFIEAAVWNPRWYNGWDRPLRTIRVERAPLDAGKNVRGFQLASHDAAPAAAVFRTLGLQVGATKPQIHRAFRRAARHVHPDVGGSAEAFRDLQAAYETALRLTP
jgi:hypothetical protein